MSAVALPSVVFFESVCLHGTFCLYLIAVCWGVGDVSNQGGAILKGHEIAICLVVLDPFLSLNSNTILLFCPS